MQFDLDDDRALLKQSTREMLEKEASLADSRALMEGDAVGFSRSFYGQLAELGYLGLALPESAGGAAVGCRGLAAVLEEMGRVAFPGPYLDLAIAADLLHRAGGDEAGRWLDRLLTGDALVVLARAESLNGVEPEAPATRADGGRVRGVKRFVSFGAQADALLVATAEGLVIAPRPADGWDATPLETLDLAQRFAEIRLDGSAEPLLDATSAGPALEAAERLGALGAAALLLGIADRAMELAVDYTSGREAFGKPIASFQTLQHRMADMLIRTESTRAAVYRAAWSLDEEPERAPLLVAVAKAYAGDAAHWVCGQSIQLHGGVGYTWEYDPHVYFKRVQTLRQFYGTTRDQLDAVLTESGI